MKKRISVVLLALVVLLTGCNGEASLKYYDKYAEQNENTKKTRGSSEAQHTPLVINAREANMLDDLYDTYMEVKDKLRNELAPYQNLNWERFENAKLYLCDSFNEESGGFGINGLWDVRDGMAYFAYSLSEKDPQFQHEVMAHELIHALTAKAGEASTLLYEGFTEYLAQTIYPTSVDTDCYFFPQLFVTLYVEKNGIQAAIDLFPTDAAADEIGEAIGRPNAMYTITPLLYETCNGIYYDKQLEVIIEVLAYYSAAIGANPETIEEINIMNNTGGRDNKYYEYIKSVLEAKKEVDQ